MSNEYKNYNKIHYKIDDYYNRDSRVTLIKSTHQENSHIWSGNIPEGVNNYSELGVIDYYLQVNSDGQAVTLKLLGSNNNEAQALPVKYSKKDNGTWTDTQVTDEFGVGCLIRLAYIDSSTPVWKVIGSTGGSSGGISGITVTTDKASKVSFSQGTLPTLSYDGVSSSRITNWGAGSSTEASIENGVLNITNGSEPTLSYNSVNASNINSYNSGTLPSLTSTEIDVVTSVSVKNNENTTTNNEG